MITIDKLNNWIAPVNSIELPMRFVEIASYWHGGIDCILYAIASVGTVKTGTNCIITDYTSELDRQQKCYYLLWCELSDKLDSLIVGWGKHLHDDDYNGLVDFKECADGIVEVLEYQYDLEDYLG